MSRFVEGIYATLEEAQAAVDRLLAEGYEKKDLTFVAGPAVAATIRTHSRVEVQTPHSTGGSPLWESIKSTFRLDDEDTVTEDREVKSHQKEMEEGRIILVARSRRDENVTIGDNDDPIITGDLPVAPPVIPLDSDTGPDTGYALPHTDTARFDLSSDETRAVSPGTGNLGARQHLDFPQTLSGESREPVPAEEDAAVPIEDWRSRSGSPAETATQTGPAAERGEAVSLTPESASGPGTAPAEQEQAEKEAAKGDAIRVVPSEKADPAAPSYDAASTEDPAARNEKDIER